MSETTIAEEATASSGANASAPAVAAALQPVESFAKAKNLPAWLFAAARAYYRWPKGQEMTEANFDAAIAEVQALTFGV